MSAAAVTPEWIKDRRREMSCANENRQEMQYRQHAVSDLLDAIEASRAENAVIRRQLEERRVGPDEVVVDMFTVGAVYNAINRGCKVGILGLGMCGDRDMMHKPLLCPSCAAIKSRMPYALRTSAQAQTDTEKET